MSAAAVLQAIQKEEGFTIKQVGGCLRPQPEIVRCIIAPDKSSMNAVSSNSLPTPEHL
jgi:hypothetical protein